jgi:hypothetical protein
MIGDPRDVWAYRFAIGALGLALVVVITGAIVLAALDGPSVAISSKTQPTPHNGLATKTDPGSRAVSIGPNVSITVTDPTDPGGSKIPTGLYVLGGALIAALLGIMVPLPWSSTFLLEQWLYAKGDISPAVTIALVLAIVLTGALVLVILLGLPEKWAPHEDLAIVGVAALLGLLVPSPAVRW